MEGFALVVAGDHVFVFHGSAAWVVQGAASLQLQGIAARSSVYVIQTLGIPAVAMGHAIQVSDWPKPLDVADVCSGLKMLMLFFAMCVGAAFIVKRELWEKIVMVISAVPIAVASNVIRIVTIALVCELSRNWPPLLDLIKWLSDKPPEKFIDLVVGICVMMPAGLLMLWVEMTLLSKLMIEPLPDRPLSSASSIREQGTKENGKRNKHGR